MEQPVRVILVDDHQLFREGIRFLVDQMKHVVLVGEASNHEELEALLKTEVPEVMLLDLDMPEKDGVEVLKEVKAAYPDMKVIILTMYSDPKMMTYLMELGANGYLLKDTDSDELEKPLKRYIGKNCTRTACWPKRCSEA